MRVVLPLLPLHVAATALLPTLKTVLSLPLVSPLTGPSKVSVSAIVSPTLLPGVPDTVVKATEGAVEPSVGAVVSTTGSGVASMFGMLPPFAVYAKALPAASRTAVTSAVFSAASSIAAWPFCPTAMV